MLPDDPAQETEAELYDDAPCGYLSTRPDGLIVKVNRTLLSWLGAPRESLVGKRRFQELLSIPGQIFFENHFHPILLAESRVSEIAFELKVPDGRLPVLVTGALKRGAGGAPAVVRLTLFNATERRAYEQTLLRKTKELDQLNSRKNELLGMAAHDLRTPLNAVLAYSNVLASEIGPSLRPSHLELLNTIIDMSANMSDLITDILDVASIESGSLRLDRKATPIDPILRRAVSINAILAGKKRISIESDAADSGAFCLVDARKIDQVLNNLLGNAIKFSHPGTSIKVFMASDPDRVTIAIHDQGQGIPAGELETIFTPFTKGSVRSTAGEPSSGLGLAIAHSIVTGHGGKLWVNSSVGAGSTFSFTLPRTTPQPPPEARAVAGQVTAGPRMTRVLVADDTLVNQKIVARMLAKLGVEVRAANNGREALALLEQEDFDVVLMDCQMPIMDGYEAAAGIRFHERRAGRGKHVPIIALSASAREDDRRRGLEAGMDDFLLKPASERQLHEMLERWMAVRAGPENEPA